jgi:hypothetical protein
MDEQDYLASQNGELSAVVAKGSRQPDRQACQTEQRQVGSRCTMAGREGTGEGHGPLLWNEGVKMVVVAAAITNEKERRARFEHGQKTGCCNFVTVMVVVVVGSGQIELSSKYRLMGQLHG